jgi:hypothetical protein
MTVVCHLNNSVIFDQEIWYSVSGRHQFLGNLMIHLFEVCIANSDREISCKNIDWKYNHFDAQLRDGAT